MQKKQIEYQLKFKSADQKLLLHNLTTILFELKKNINFIKLNKINIISSNTKRFCVLRSPFVDKVSKEHFEIRVFQVIVTIVILDSNNFFFEKTFEKYLNTTLKFQELNISYKKIKKLIP